MSRTAWKSTPGIRFADATASPQEQRRGTRNSAAMAGFSMAQACISAEQRRGTRLFLGDNSCEEFRIRDSMYTTVLFDWPTFTHIRLPVGNATLLFHGHCRVARSQHPPGSSNGGNGMAPWWPAKAWWRATCAAIRVEGRRLLHGSHRSHQRPRAAQGGSGQLTSP